MQNKNMAKLNGRPCVFFHRISKSKKRCCQISHKAFSAMPSIIPSRSVQLAASSNLLSLHREARSLPLFDQQHGTWAGRNSHLCIRGNGLQENPGTVPTTAGEQGGWFTVKANDLGLSRGGSDSDIVMLVPQSCDTVKIFTHTIHYSLIYFFTEIKLCYF